MQRVAIADISTDAGTQIRASINEAVVSEYAEQMTAGVVFPPVVLFHDGNRYYLADGFHRVMAASRIHLQDVPADVRAGTKTDALWFALGANKANGQRLSEADKRHAIELAYAAWPDMGQRELADQIGCSQQYVSTVRKQIQVTSGCHLPDYITGKDGKQYPASRGPNQASAKKREAIAALVKDGVAPVEIAATVGASLTTVTKVRREMGVPVVDKSRAAVARRRQDIRDFASQGYSTRQIAAKVGITETAVGDIARAESIVIHADKVVGRTRRIDSNRIVEQMALQAENLCADVDLIDFSEIDRERLGEWLDSLKRSRDTLGAFIRRLMKEQQGHVEVA